MDALLSVDLGTTGCKAAVCSAAGQVLGTSYLEYPLINLAPGWVEQDADLWWSLAQQAVRQALAHTPGDCRIHGLSISSQGISFVPIDRAGRVLRRAINWLDTRAEAEAALIRERIGDRDLFQLTGKRPAAFYLLPKLLWLRRHEPDLCRATDRFLLAHDFLLHRLCGAAVTDYSLAGGTLLLDLHALTWSERLLTTFAVDPGQLPDLAWAGTVAGALAPAVARSLGLAAGTPVVVGGQDQKCAALGAGIRPGRVTVSLGTAAAISCLVDRPVLDEGQRIPVYPFVAPGYWVLEGVIGTAGAALKWAREALYPGKTYAELDQLAAGSPPGANGVRFYPHLAGAASPVWQAAARGAFTGLSLATGPADIVRSVLEGIAFQIRANLAAMATLAPVEELVLFGGGARSALWAQIIAEATSLRVGVAEMVDVANWGACLLAGVGVGLCPDRLAAGSGATCEPSPAAIARYDGIYQEYIAGEKSLIGTR